MIDDILCATFGRTFLWGCVVPDWRDEVCAAVERWIEIIGVSAAAERGGRPQLKPIGRARRESTAGWYAVDVRDRRIDPDQIDDLRLAGASQPGPGEGFSPLEVVQDGRLLRVRVAEFVDLPEAYLWQNRRPEGFLVTQLRDGLRAVGDSGLAHELAAGRLTPVPSTVRQVSGFSEAQREADAVGWTVLLVAVFVGYVAAAGAAVVRRGSAQRVSGLAFGVFAGLLWLGEIWTQAPARLPVGLERTLPVVCAALAVVTTVGAGAVGGLVGGTGVAALRTGVWAGLVSGAIMVSGMIAIQTSNLGLLGARADYQRELAASGTTDMAAYIAGDAVAAAMTHMVINVGLGLVGAGIGWIIAVTRQPAGSATT